MLLEFENVSAYYADPSFRALADVSFGVRQGDTVAILGTNGAGKSTVLRAVARQAALSCGVITFAGEVLNPLLPHEVASRGLAYVPEGHRVWPNMTVEENLQLGAYATVDERVVSEALEWVYEVVPKVAALRRRLAHGLSGGERQLVAVGRALVARPRCLLLDEPSLGLAPGAADEVFEIIGRAVRDTQLTALVVEQNCARALALADRVIVLRLGRIVLDALIEDVSWDADIEPLLLADAMGAGSP